MPRAAPIHAVVLATLLVVGCEERRATSTTADPVPPAERPRPKAAPSTPDAPSQPRRPDAKDAAPDSGPPSAPPFGEAPRLGSAESGELAPLEDTGPSCDAIYTVSQGDRLYAFDPRKNKFSLRGTIRCADVTPDTTPFSMAVARTGVAHVLFSDGGIREVDLADARCAPTTYRRHQLPEFGKFGMSYAKSELGDSLYVAAIPQDGRSALARAPVFPGDLERLGTIDVEGAPKMIELTATPKGLWGFATYDDRPGRLAKIDRQSGKVTTVVPLTVGQEANGLAIAWFGGRFYIFTHVTRTTVTRYDPATGTTKVVAVSGDKIVGAGASTCVPAS